MKKHTGENYFLLSHWIRCKDTQSNQQFNNQNRPVKQRCKQGTAEKQFNKGFEKVSHPEQWLGKPITCTVCQHLSNYY